MTIRLERYGDDRVVIESDFPMRDRELLKALPGSSYSSKTHLWTAPLTWATCVAMRGMFGNELIVGPHLAEWSNEEYHRRVLPAMTLRTSWDDPSLEEIFPQLYPFQRAGVSFLSFAEQALLTDEMGTGKTPQTIFTLMNNLRLGKDPFPALVIAPNNMVLTWKKEIERFWPGAVVNVIKGHAGWRREMIKKPAHFYVMNFEGVRTHSKLAGYGSIRLRRCYQCDPSMPNDRQHQPSRCEVHPKELNQKAWKTLIIDEAHRMKDPGTKQSRAIKALRTRDTRFVYCLTGTPLGDAPVDLWPALNLISPYEFPSRQAFIDRYCLIGYSLFGTMNVIGLNPQNKEEFFKIVEPRFRRMPKAAVLPFLPDKVRTTRYVEMHPKQAKAYAQMDKNEIAVLVREDGTAGVAVAANPLTELTRLMQFSSAYAEKTEDGHVRLSKPSNKIEALLELLEEMGETEPAVVFAQSRQLIELTAQELDAHKITYSKIVGGQNAWEREEAKDRFQNGQVRVILCTIAAGGIGITLTRSKYAIFLQRSWSMIENKQAEDRVHRIGSEVHDVINIVDIVSVGTIEEGQMMALAGKEDRLQEFVRDADIVASMQAEEG